jgi:hypothetical protein
MESKVGILHRKKINTSKLEGSSFSSLSLLPDEFNRSLSDVDNINTMKTSDSYGIETPLSDIEFGPTDDNQQKIFLQTTGPRGIKGNSQNDIVLVYNTTFGGKMVFPLEKKETTIGRKDNNDIVLSDGKISKKHAIIIKNDDRYFDDLIIDFISRIITHQMVLELMGTKLRPMYHFQSTSMTRYQSVV